MKKIAFVMVAAVCAVALIGGVAGETNPDGPPGAWTPIGPFGGNIAGLARNPKAASELFAVCKSYPAQLFRSGNNGSSWSRVSLINDRVNHLALDPKTPGKIYLLYDSTLRVSTDKGKTFTSRPFPSYFSTYGCRLAVHPANPQVILVGGYFTYDVVNWHSEMAVARTTNGGTTWTIKKLTPGTDSGYVRDLAFAKSNPNYVYACGYTYTNGLFSAQAFVSKNGGNAWTKVSGSPVFQSSSTACYSVQVDPRNPKKAWIGHAGGIARTSNAGASWQAQSASSITRVTALAADSANPNILYAGGAYNYKVSALKSTDGGVTWTAVSDGVYGEPRAILASGANVHLASEAGVFRSLNGGAVWKPSQTGIRATDVKSFGIAPSAPNTIYAGLYGYAVLKTINGGGAWAPCAEFYGSNLIESIAVHPTNPNTLYAKPSG